MTLSYVSDVHTTRSFHASSSRTMKTLLRYMEKGEDVDANSVVDMGDAVFHVNVDDDKMLVENLAFSLDMDEMFLNEQYQTWVRKYNKTADNARFFNWKRNFLMQEVWNRTNGETFDLNEYGDLTKQEFDAMKKEDESISAVDSSPETAPLVAPLVDASHAYFFDDGDNIAEKPKQKFKQVQTFSGGYRMVPCTDSDAQLLAAAKPLPNIDSRATIVDKMGSSTTDQGQRFRKVQLFSGGFMIVPNVKKN